MSIERSIMHIPTIIIIIIIIIQRCQNNRLLQWSVTVAKGKRRRLLPYTLVSGFVKRLQLHCKVRSTTSGESGHLLMCRVRVQFLIWSLYRDLEQGLHSQLLSDINWNSNNSWKMTRRRERMSIIPKGISGYEVIFWTILRVFPSLCWCLSVWLEIKQTQLFVLHMKQH